MVTPTIKSDEIYQAFLNGANQVINNAERLNQINVFPIQDGDTGNNLASMMKTMMSESDVKLTVKETLESFSNAAIRGARGNSGIIFAQYLNGLSNEMDDQFEIDYSHYAKASQKAVDYAYRSIDQPVEGTILTVMNEWGSALIDRLDALESIEEALHFASERVDEVLTNTQYQLEELKKAKVVDAGAKGFTLFIQGISDYFDHKKPLDLSSIMNEKVHLEPIEVNHNIHEKIDHRYCTECLIEGKNLDDHAIRQELSTFGDSLVVAGSDQVIRIHIHTNQPTEVFDILHEKGRVAYQKVDDMKKQQDIVLNRQYDTAILTDSIGDIPVEIMDEKQIHMMHLNLLFKDTSFIDKSTITTQQIIDYSNSSYQLPTSSQPDETSVENILTYLKNYYKSLIIITVSSALSGTYNTLKRVAERVGDEEFDIRVIDSKQNSGAQGLLVNKAANLLEEGCSVDEIEETIRALIPKSKILVQVKTLDSMIKSGRLSTRMGKIGKQIGLKPIVTLDDEGDGGLAGLAFTDKGSLNRLKSHINKVMKNHEIEAYNIVHVNNYQEALEVKELFTKIIGFEPEYITETSSIVAVSAGDQSVALSYILKN